MPEEPSQQGQQAPASESSPFERVPAIRNSIQRLALWFTFTLVWALLLPGIAAQLDGVFSDEDVRRKIPLDASQALERYETQQSRLASVIQNMEEEMAQRASEREFSAETLGIIQARAALSRVGDSAMRPPVRIRGFFGNYTPYIWVVTYLFLGLLVLTAPAPLWSGVSVWRTLKWSLVFSVLFQWPQWLRATLIKTTGRHYFSYVHLDISPLSYVLQELRILGVLALIVILLQQRVLLVDFTLSEVRDWCDETQGQYSCLGKRAHFISELFTHWELESLVLIGTFLPWTYYFWSTQAQVEESRYFVTAMLMHITWVATWCVVSAPLWLSLKEWNRYRLSLLAAAAEKERSDSEVEPNRALQVLQAVTPLGRLRVIVSSLAAFVSFLIPLLNLL